MDTGGAMLTADEAKAWLRSVLADRGLVGIHWDRLVAIDKGLGLHPPLIWAASLIHRDGIMAEPDLWASLHDGLRTQMIVLSDDELAGVVGMIIDNAVACYGQPAPDDDDGGVWSVWSRDLGRFLTKAEAVLHIARLVTSGDHQPILDRLARWDDSFKTMLAAIPLESETATADLVLATVKGVVVRGYSETAQRGGEWSHEGSS
ncbi:hypothetical protein [Mycobacterium sp. ENV421]|uniref:hypothetical protein n=1 Tax=Mycobacterium sp. ENV421 TaxID=1213407 RepID=UPI000C9AB8FE|nr:hypothetical protein [Mycobacterium sp. ENV421]